MFHVPEAARVRDHPTLGTDATAGNNGAFDLASCVPGWRLTLICSDGSAAGELELEPWEHVSVHAYRYDGRQKRTPTWDEMCFVKGLCWDAEDVVVQLHPARSSYVNLHPNVLHLWRPVGVAVPVPPLMYV